MHGARTGGDVAARVAVRFDEVFESLRLIRASCRRCRRASRPTSRLRAERAAAPAGSRAGAARSSSRWTAPPGGTRSAAAICHDPSWQNWPVLEHAVIGNIVPDFPLINKSFNLQLFGARPVSHVEDLRQIARTGIAHRAAARRRRRAARRGRSHPARPARHPRPGAAIRQVDAGSCNGCELEIHALNNPYYNIEGLGIRFVASPRHADLLLVTGPVSRNMEQALRRTYDATPDPKLVVAVGDCGCDGGIFGESYASCGRVANVIPVDVAVPGCPPPPIEILRGILTAVRRDRC